MIPARGGSKSIPRKNVVPLAGRPLLAYTCDAALGSQRLTRVVLSTDDEEIAAMGRACGVEVPFRRPAELATDEASALAVIQHALKWLREHDDYQPDILVYLQPTSPLRRSRHVDEAVELLLADSQADSVVSVVEVPHLFSPYSIQHLVDGYLVDFWQEPADFDRFTRQAHPLLYARNGAAVYATRTQVLLEKNSIFGDRCLPYLMKPEESVDIDTPFDLFVAECLLNRRLAQEAG